MVPGLCPQGPVLITPILATWPGTGDFLALVLSDHFHYSPVFVVSFQCPLSKLRAARGQRPPVLLTAISQSLAWCLHTLDPRGYPLESCLRGKGLSRQLPGGPSLRASTCQTVGIGPWEWGSRPGLGGWGARLGCWTVCSLEGWEGIKEMQYVHWARLLPGCSRCPPKLEPAQSRTPHWPQAVSAAHAASLAQPVLHATGKHAGALRDMALSPRHRAALLHAPTWGGSCGLGQVRLRFRLLCLGLSMLYTPTLPSVWQSCLSSPGPLLTERGQWGETGLLLSATLGQEAPQYRSGPSMS